MAQEAWGRWGADDEAGAPNLIGPPQVKHAISLVKTGQVISLTQPISDRLPVPFHRANVQHFMGRDGGDYAAGAKRPGGFQFAEDTVILPLHLGTTSMRCATPGATIICITGSPATPSAARRGRCAAAWKKSRRS